eukprot:2086586-Prymnesium_polylepis.1
MCRTTRRQRGVVSAPSSHLPEPSGIVRGAAHARRGRRAEAGRESDSVVCRSARRLAGSTCQAV